MPKDTRLALGLPMIGVSLFGYVFGSPVVHAIHGHPVDPLFDPTMRNAASIRMAGLFGGCATAFFSGLALAGGIGDRRPDDRPGAAATVVPITALGLGLLVPIAVDVALFTYDPRRRTARGSESGFSIAASGAGVLGTFD